MKNRVLSAVILALLLGSCKKDSNSSKKGCTDPNSFNYDPKATESDGSCREMAGCLGYAGGLSNSGTLGNTFKNSQNDAFMSGEVNTQKKFWSTIPATVYVLYETDERNKNAYATADGRILFGYYMFYYLVQKFSVISPTTTSPLPVAGVLAHEWGHRAQFTIGWNNYAKPAYRELEADFFSGYYMGLAKQWYWSQIQTYYNAIYASGDYDFNSPLHHGTPEQRVNAAYLGLKVAVYALNNKIQYTYQQLHDTFIQNVHSEIGARTDGNGRTQAGRYPEVVYPKDLTKADIERLYPRK